MRIVVVGPGAVGSLVASLLARRSEVTLAGRGRPSPATGAHLGAIEREGLSLAGALSGCFPLGVSRGPAGPLPDVLLLAVKAPDTGEALREFAPLLGPNTSLLLLQNGVGNEGEAEGHLPRGRVGRGVTYLGAERVGAGRVRLAAMGRTLLGPAFPEGTGEGWATLAELFDSCGLPATSLPFEAMRREVWRKAAGNLLINAPGALLRLRNGELFEDERVRPILVALAREAQEVLRAEGAGEVDVWGEAEETARATASNKNSLWQDLEAGRRTEIDALNGALVRLAARHGLEAPTHRALALTIRMLEGSRRGGTLDRGGPGP